MTQQIDYQKHSKEFFNFLQKYDNFLIPLHLSPDGDMLASALSISNVLDSFGKKYSIVSEDNAFTKFNYFPGFEKLKWGFVYPDKAAKDFGAVMILDMHHKNGQILPRFMNVPTNEDKLFFENVPTMYVDHHVKDEHFINPGLEVFINYGDPDISSTSELLFHLVDHSENVLSKETATLLYFGIFFDTGGFIGKNVYPSTLRSIASLLEQGADVDFIQKNAIKNHSFFDILYAKTFFSHFTISPDSTYVWSYIPYDEFYKVLYENSGTETDTSSLREHYLNSVKGTYLGLVLHEKKPGFITYSIRAREGIDVSAISRECGNGDGHKAAAGGVIKDKTLDKALEKLKTIIKSHIKAFVASK